MKQKKILVFLFIFFLSFICLGKESKAKSKKFLPSHLQKAYTLQRDAFVYTRADFDSLRITTIPAGSLVTVSKRVYRPKTNFGTFYRIYVNRPKKLKAYISEIDVVPRYIRKGSSYQPNPEFNIVKRKLNRIRQFEANSDESGTQLNLGGKQIAQLRWIGMTVNHLWIYYASRSPAVHSWFFNIKFTGPNLPVPGLLTDINVGLSLAAPVINEKVVKKGYVIIGDFLFKTVLLEGPHFLFTLGGGLMVKAKSTRAPVRESLFQMGAAAAASAHLMIRLKDHLSVSLEGKYYYNFHEHRFSPGVGGGVLVAF